MRFTAVYDLLVVTGRLSWHSLYHWITMKVFDTQIERKEVCRRLKILKIIYGTTPDMLPKYNII